jgi:hypothetical protein
LQQRKLEVTEGAGLSRGLETGAGGLVPPWWYACKPSWFRTSLGTIDSQFSPSSILSKNESRSGGAMMPAIRFLFEIQLLNFRAFERLTMVGNIRILLGKSERLEATVDTV